MVILVNYQCFFMKIKFINLNLWAVGAIFDKALDFLIKEKADILALQEVFDGQDSNLQSGFRALNILKEKLDLPYYFYSPAFTDNRKEGRIKSGNAIFSRWPIVSTKTTFIDGSYNDEYIDDPKNYPYVPRNLQQAVIQSNKISLNIFNTQGIWGLDGDDNERRLKMSQDIVNQIKENKNAILAGDFNVKEKTKSIRNIEKYLNNIFKGERTTSFNMKRKTNPGFGTAVVDFIFASPNFKVIDHQCPQIDVSDHLPLVTVLEV